MSVVYTIRDKGKNVSISAGTTFSRYSDEQLEKLNSEMAKENYPMLYEKYKNNQEVINIIGYNVYLSERYSLLLELLPQSSYSKAGTHPRWVAEAVDENTLHKEITQSDIKDMIFGINNLDELKLNLAEYFEVENY